MIDRLDPTSRRRPNSVREPLRFSIFVISPAVAALYAVLGLATLTLAQMTGLAAPVWPAAGVAMAAALNWRLRALPGVFAGSVGVNAYWLTRLGEPASQAWFVAAAIGIGAVLGAGAGATLIDRFLGEVRRLDTPRAVMLALALAGLAASTIAPTIGVAAQLSTGLLSTSRAPLGWLTWWVGDAIGVIVFMPLVLMLLPSRAEHWSGRRWEIAVPSLLGFAILTAAILQNSAQERTRLDGAVAQLGDRAATDLAATIALHEEALRGLGGLVDSSDTVTAEEFRTYTRDMLTRFPNLGAVSWNPLVTKSKLETFEAVQRAQTGLGDFTVTERGANGNLRPVLPRPEYVAVAYIEPISNNRSALGFDIYSNPARAAAIETARDSGQPTATSPVDLVQGSYTQKGMLALMPIYEGGSDPGSESARRGALRGYAVGVYRLSDLLAETFRGPDWDNVNLTLIDVSESAPPVVLADLPARDAATPDQISAAPTATTSPIEIYGRTWELTVRPTSAAFTDSHSSVTAILLLAALAVTLLLEAFLLILSGTRSLANRLTSELNGAAHYFTSILPDDRAAPVPVTARHISSGELSGDSFGHRWVDDDHLIVYLVDVSGHGVASAMLSVSVHNLLRSGTLDDDTLRDPSRVLTELNQLFQMERQAGNYFTIWYGVYQHSTRTLRYAGAGHPPALILTTDGSEPARLPSGSIPVGILEDATFRAHSHPLPTNAELLIYSDGAFDLAPRGGLEWALEDFIDLCDNTARSPHWTLEDLVDQLRNRSGTSHFNDDCTLVRVTVA